MLLSKHLKRIRTSQMLKKNSQTWMPRRSVPRIPNLTEGDRGRQKFRPIPQYSLHREYSLCQRDFQFKSRRQFFYWPRPEKQIQDAPKKDRASLVSAYLLNNFRTKTNFFGTVFLKITNVNRCRNSFSILKILDDLLISFDAGIKYD